MSPLVARDRLHCAGHLLPAGYWICADPRAVINCWRCGSRGRQCQRATYSRRPIECYGRSNRSVLLQPSFQLTGHPVERLRSVEHRVLCRRRGEIVSFCTYLLRHQAPPANFGHRSMHGLFFRAPEAVFECIRLIVFIEAYANDIPTRGVVARKFVGPTSMIVEPQAHRRHHAGQIGSPM